MNLLSWGYIAILLIALGVSLWLRHAIVFAARVRWGWRLFYLIGAALAGGLTWLTSGKFTDLVSGGFIVGMFLVFAFWPRGLTNEALVNGLGTLRAYRVLTEVQLSANNSGTLVTAKVGAVTVVTMRLREAPAPVAKWLKQRMDPQRVIITK
ncbi:hypothetical protein [Lacticaseibacillus nasuensis]|uniref:Uncharacterized protein n=2 Tax=Lacticaseibacillus TaxID=2759736 RepID=A0A0R1JSE7_9LACO|nr:hypothetical protein [Lacticaseibacillus nasuensis]KRK74205.1 hypothetical protein FD02_GL000800 [Lacticaseibacillus nasuensis JCM 17158]